MAKLVRSKYGAKKTQVNGITFDSKAEANRYEELLLLERAGLVSNIELQKKFVLLPSKRNAEGYLERETAYVADFVYVDSVAGLVVEDVKSPATRTSEYVIKRKLMLHVHGITIKEVGVKPRKLKP